MGPDPRDLNRAGYQFLVILNPGNPNYSVKANEYSRSASGVGPGTYWVNDPKAQHPALYSCASSACGKVGELYQGNKVSVKEVSDNFARVTDYYPVTCVNGEMRGDVDSGKADCSVENGVRDGQIARWIEASYLAPTEPEAPTTSSEAEKWVASSDDFSAYHAQFATAAEDLVSSGRCSKEDFISQGGWAPSGSGMGKYYIWCRNLSVKYILNVRTGHIN